MLDSIAGSEPRQDCRFFIFVIRGYEDRDRLADYFIGGVAKNALCSLIPARNDAFKSFTNNRIVG